MSKFKRFLALTLSVILAMSLFASAALADEGSGSSGGEGGSGSSSGGSSEGGSGGSSEGGSSGSSESGGGGSMGDSSAAEAAAAAAAALESMYSPGVESGSFDQYLKVKFDFGDGSVETRNVIKGNTVRKPSNPYIAGYDFTGWYTDKACTKPYDFDSKVTNSFTLYAGWEEAESIDPEELEEEVLSGAAVSAKTEDVNFANNEVRVTLGSTLVNVGGTVRSMGAAPYIQKDTNSLLVPLRFVAAALGDETDYIKASSLAKWDAVTKTATIEVSRKVVSFTAGSNIMTVDGKEMPIPGGVRAEISGSRIYIPFRALGEALGIDVDWDEETRTAIYRK